MKNIKVLTALIFSILMFLAGKDCGFAQEKLGDIIYEDDSNIYIEYEDEILKLKKDFSYYYERLSEGEKTSVVQSAEKNKFRVKSYCVREDVPGIMEIWSGRFKYFSPTRLENEGMDLGRTIGSFNMSDAALKIGRKGEYLLQWIPSYEVNGELYIIAEDLEHYGYSVDWDEKNRITVIEYQEGKQVDWVKSHRKESGSIYESDVEIWVDGKKKDSLNIGGYSLISARQLDENENIIIYRDYYEEDRELQISGYVRLPAGKSAPEEGISGNLFLYTYGYKSQPQKLGKVPFEIPEGSNRVKYTIDKNTIELITGEEYVSGEYFSYGGIFLGYEIHQNDLYLDGRLENESGRPLENYHMLARFMDDYSVDYGNVDIEILPRAEISGNIVIPEHLKGFDSDDTRQIRVKAVDISGDEYVSCISRILVVSRSETDIPYHLEVIGGKSYALHCEIKLNGIFPPRYGLWAGGDPVALDKGYLGEDGKLHENMEDAKVFSIGDDVSNIDISAAMHEYKGANVGTAQETDIAVYISGSKVRSVNVSGNMAVFAEDLSNARIDMDTGKSANYTDEPTDGESVGLKGDGIEEKANPKSYAVKSFGDTILVSGKPLCAYDYSGEKIVMVKDLKKAGCIVEFDAKSRIVNIEPDCQ